MEANEELLAEVSLDRREVINAMTDAIQDAMTINNQLLNGLTNENNQNLFPVVNNDLQNEILFTVVKNSNDDQILSYDTDINKGDQYTLKDDNFKSNINTYIDDNFSDNVTSLQNFDPLQYCNQVFDLDLNIDNPDDSTGKVVLDTSSDSDNDADGNRDFLTEKYNTIDLNPSFSCSECNNHFSKWTELRKHQLTHTEIDVYKCMKCDYKGVSKRDLNKHLTSHSDKKFSCNMCEYKCKERKSLRMHLLTHTGEKPFSCKECDFKCSQKGNLKVHMLTHSSKRPFQCADCNVKFTQKIHFTNHMKYHHEDKMNKKNENQSHLKFFSSYNCSFTCKSEIFLKKHITDHKNSMPLSCSKCGFSCKNTNSSEITSTNHETMTDEMNNKKDKLKLGILPQVTDCTFDIQFSCIFCEFLSTDRDVLKEHLLITHTGSHEIQYSGVKYKLSIEPIFKATFNCPDCSYKSDKKRNLDSHLLTHSEVKMFECSFCKFKSKRNGDLKTHIMMKHVGEKTHSCNQCLYKSSQKSNLLKHMKIHAN